MCCSFHVGLQYIPKLAHCNKSCSDLIHGKKPEPYKEEKVKTSNEDKKTQIYYKNIKN